MKTITTTKGPMTEDALEKRTGGHDNDWETVSWVEYWLDGELVHRSADVFLKQAPTFAEGVAASF